jgi:hypothetical protein
LYILALSVPTSFDAAVFQKQILTSASTTSIIAGTALKMLRRKSFFSKKTSAIRVARYFLFSQLLPAQRGLDFALKGHKSKTRSV